MSIIRIGAYFAGVCLFLCLCSKNPTALPTLTVSSARQIVGNDSGNVKIEAVLSEASKSTVTIPVVISGNSTANSPQDYTLDSAQIVIHAGDSTGSIILSLVGQAVYDTSKTVILSLGAPTNAKLGTHIIDTVFIVNAKEFGQQYKFADNELPGWIQNPDTLSTPFTVWKGEDLVGLIDGGADLYTDRGCLLSMYQNLIGPNGPDSQVCTVVAMDFVTNASAASMFGYMKESDSANIIAIPQFDTSVAVASTGIAGNITAYAHFKEMYFELQLSGYASRDSSCSEAMQMLKVLELKTK
ncbi:MAG: hypothetical protein WBM07_06830 [Chitinivibrionales bacterium]